MSFDPLPADLVGEILQHAKLGRGAWRGACDDIQRSIRIKPPSGGRGNATDCITLLRRLRNLKRLRLQGCDYPTLKRVFREMQEISVLPNLHTLCVTRSRLAHSVLLQMSNGRNFQKIEKLSFAGSLPSEKVSFFPHIHRVYPGLKYLDLRCNALDRYNPAFLLSSLTVLGERGLKGLCLNSCLLAPKFFEGLAGSMPSFSCLEDLDVGGNECEGNDFCRLIEGLCKGAHVRRIAMGRLGIVSDVDPQALENAIVSLRSKELDYFDLSSMILHRSSRDDGSPESAILDLMIAAVRGEFKVRSVCGSSNRLYDSLNDIRISSSIQVLNLSQCELSANFLGMWQKACEESRHVSYALRCLNLSLNRFSGVTREVMAGLLPQSVFPQMRHVQFEASSCENDLLVGLVSLLSQSAISFANVSMNPLGAADVCILAKEFKRLQPVTDRHVTLAVAYSEEIEQALGRSLGPHSNIETITTTDFAAHVRPCGSDCTAVS